MRALLFLLLASVLATAQEVPADKLFGVWRLVSISGGFGGGSYDPGPDFYVITVAPDTAESTAVVTARSHDTLVSERRAKYDLLFSCLLGSSYCPSWVMSHLQSYSDSSYTLWDGVYDGYSYRYAKLTTGIRRQPTLRQRPSQPDMRKPLLADLTGRRAARDEGSGRAWGMLVKSTGARVLLGADRR
jgi:hypothetical protein